MGSLYTLKWKAGHFCTWPWRAGSLKYRPESGEPDLSVLGKVGWVLSVLGAGGQNFPVFGAGGLVLSFLKAGGWGFYLLGDGGLGISVLKAVGQELSILGSGVWALSDLVTGWRGLCVLLT